MSTEFFKTKQSMFGLANDNLLSDLLVKSGVVDPKRLKEISGLPSNRRMSLGQMLLVGGYVTQNTLDVTLKAEAYIKDKIIDLNTAIKIIRTALKTGDNFENVLASEQHGQNKSYQGNKLGDLLIEASIINQDQLNICLQKSQSLGLPLGRVMVLNNFITENCLNAALEIQVRVRDEMLPRSQAVEVLRVVSGRYLSNNADAYIAEQAKQILENNTKQRGRLGELLVNAGILNETDIVNALEIQMQTGELLGQILIHQGFVNQQLLDATLRIQKKIYQGTLEYDCAIEALKIAYRDGLNFDDAVLKVCSSEIDKNACNLDIEFYRLLIKSQIITEKKLREAFNFKNKQALLLAKILNLTGDLDENLLITSLKVYYMLSKNSISKEDAVYILNRYNEKLANITDGQKLTLEDLLSDLSWQKHVQLAKDTKYEDIDIDEITSDIPDPSWQEIEDTSFNDKKDFRQLPSQIIDDVPDPSIGTDDVSDGEFIDETQANSQAELVEENLMNDSLTQPSSSEQVVDSASAATIKEGHNQEVLSVNISPEAGDTTTFNSLDTSLEPDQGVVASRTDTMANDDGSVVLAKAQVNLTVLEKMVQLANTFFESENFGQAEALYEQIIFHKQEEYSANSPVLLDDYNNLAACLCAQSKFTKVEPIMFKIITIIANNAPVDLFQLSESLEILAGVYCEQEKYQESLPLLERSLKIKMQTFGENSAEVANCLREIAKVLRKLDKVNEAELKYAQARKILAKLNNN